MAWGSGYVWPCLLACTSEDEVRVPIPSAGCEPPASTDHTVATSFREVDSVLGAWLLCLLLCDFLMFLEPCVTPDLDSVYLLS